MDAPTPTPPPEDSRPGAATRLTVSGAELGELVGDLAATALIANAALKAVAIMLEVMAKDCRDKDSPPPLSKVANGLTAAREALNVPGLLSERQQGGMRALEKAICKAVETTEGKPMPPPGAAIIESLPDDPDPNAILESVKEKLARRAIALKIESAPLAPPPPYTGRNGANWSASPWNPQNN